ncbi:MAG: hypothetical protein LKJ69_08055 [Lactobacillus sp.]|jgi:FtsZ-interacting cell division protein ZipA|nr:hypothetical protein [Lactobacillus sp.]MCI2033344.1 hypothetical protein [Lactobacillus sp.]
MFQLIIAAVIIYGIWSQLRSSVDRAEKRRQKEWQQRKAEADHQNSRTAKRKYLPAQPVSTAKTTAAAKLKQAPKRKQTMPRQQAPTARRTTPTPAKPQPAPKAQPQRSTATAQTPKPTLAAHESALQRDARLHRKPLRPPATRLRPPRRTLK